ASGYVTPPPAQAPWSGHVQGFSGSVPPVQPFGAPPAGPGWTPPPSEPAAPAGPGWTPPPSGAVAPAGPGWTPPPTGPFPPASGAFRYPGQPMPGGQPAPEMYGAPPQGAYGTAPGGYAPGFGVPPGGPGVGAVPQRSLPTWFTIGAAALIIVGLFL